MKKNTFYLIIGCIAIALVGLFWYSDVIHTPLLIEVAFIVAVAAIYLIRRQVTDLAEDERDVKITEAGSAADDAGLLGRLLCIFYRGSNAVTQAPRISEGFSP